MSQRLATKVGLVPEDARRADARDLVRVNEPTVGAPVRTKGSLYLLAQLTNAGTGTVQRDPGARPGSMSARSSSSSPPHRT